MDCPACGHTGAYVGFTEVECCQANCRYYKGKRIGGVFISSPRGYLLGYSDHEIAIDAPVARNLGSVVWAAAPGEPISGFCVHFEWFDSIPSIHDRFERFLEEKR